MGVEFQGNLIGTGKTFGIIVSRFNNFITKRLLDGATDVLTRHGVKEEDIDTFWVPGSYEIQIIAWYFPLCAALRAVIGIS